MDLTAFCLFLPKMNWSRSLRPAAGRRTRISVPPMIPNLALPRRFHRLPTLLERQASAACFLAALAHNMTRAAGALTSAFHAKAATATIRDHLINAPARLARSARRLTLHLPERRPWSQDFNQLFSTVHTPPAL